MPASCHSLPRKLHPVTTSGPYVLLDGLDALSPRALALTECFEIFPEVLLDASSRSRRHVVHPGSLGVNESELPSELDPGLPDDRVVARRAPLGLLIAPESHRLIEGVYVFAQERHIALDRHICRAV